MGHPLEHRGYRELAVRAEAIAHRWPALAERVGGPCGDAIAAAAAEAGVIAAGSRGLMRERGIPAGPATHGTATAMAAARSVLREPFLQCDQAVRHALAEAEHVSALVCELRGHALAHGEAGLARSLEEWDAHLQVLRERLRGALADLARTDPDGAAAPLRDGPGAVAARAAIAVGALGEAVDRRS